MHAARRRLQMVQLSRSSGMVTVAQSSLASFDLVLDVGRNWNAQLMVQLFRVAARAHTSRCLRSQARTCTTIG